MQCNINDIVIYGADGICRIADISKKSMGGKEMEYYVLKPIHDTSATIYAPLDNETVKRKMRRLLSAEEIFALVKAMPDEDTIWIDNEQERRAHYKDILKRGDRTDLVKLIKTLHLHQQTQEEIGRKMHVADERLMQEAEKMLHGEFAHVLNLSHDQVLPFIMEQIEAEEKDQTPLQNT